LQEVETISIRSTLAVKPAHADETQLERFARYLDEAFDAIGHVNPYHHIYYPAHRYSLTKKSNIYTTGLAILVRDGLTIVDHNAHGPHDITHRGKGGLRGVKQTRICAHVRLQNGHPLHIFNTHLSLPTPFAREFWSGGDRMGHGPNQMQEAHKLLAFVREQSHGEPFIVLGDFNSNPGSPVYRFLTEEGGLVDAQAALQTADIETLRAWPTAGFMQLRMHLDHIFGSKGVRFLDVDESHPFGERDGRFHGLSDHVPWVARLAADV
jgi:endonuclease/exonuclease/phosphatase family metal-dependent hydrolase